MRTRTCCSSRTIERQDLFCLDSSLLRCGIDFVPMGKYFALEFKCIHIKAFEVQYNRRIANPRIRVQHLYVSTCGCLGCSYAHHGGRCKGSSSGCCRYCCCVSAGGNAPLFAGRKQTKEDLPLPSEGQHLKAGETNSLWPRLLCRVRRSKCLHILSNRVAIYVHWCVSQCWYAMPSVQGQDYRQAVPISSGNKGNTEGAADIRMSRAVSRVILTVAIAASGIGLVVGNGDVAGCITIVDLRKMPGGGVNPSELAGILVGDEVERSNGKIPTDSRNSVHLLKCPKESVAIAVFYC